MRTIPIRVDAAKLGEISLGKQGESLACRVRFYASKWHEDYPEAEYQLFVSPPGATPYLANITEDNGVVTWELAEEDTTIPGTGSVELILTDGKTKIKSVTYRTTLDKSPSSQEPGSTPQVHPTWWENAISKINEETEEAVSSIDGALESEKAEAKAAIAKATEDAIASIPEDYTALAGEVSSLKDHKADVIIDTSARAASHELHAQDGDMKVTLYGKTTETGTGDKSPDNPYTIRGVDVARVHAGGVNLFGKISEQTVTLNGITAAVDKAGNITVNGTATKNTTISLSLENPLYFSDANYLEMFVTNPNNGISAIVHSDSTKVFDQTLAAALRKSTFSKKGSGRCDQIKLYVGSGAVLNAVGLQIALSNTAYLGVYEPYTANVINPPLLPDGAPLMGNGTVDDTVENDVLIGCDKGRWLTGASTENWVKSASGVFGLALNDYNTGNLAYSSTHYTVSSTPITGNQMYWMNVFYGNRIAFASTLATVEEWRAHLADNPIYLAYRSTDYTPDKDLRVCKTVRNFNKITLTGTEAVVVTDNGTATQMFRIPLIKDTISPNTTAAPIYCNMYRHVLWNASPWDVDGSISYEQKKLLRIKDTRFTTAADFKAYLSDLYAAGTPVEITYQLGTPETYMTDQLPLRKPTGITPVTVTGSGETAVSYPCDTKSYIDRKFDALAAALLS